MQPGQTQTTSDNKLNTTGKLCYAFVGAPLIGASTGILALFFQVLYVLSKCQQEADCTLPPSSPDGFLRSMPARSTSGVNCTDSPVYHNCTHSNSDAVIHNSVYTGAAFGSAVFLLSMALVARDATIRCKRLFASSSTTGLFNGNLQQPGYGSLEAGHEESQEKTALELENATSYTRK